MKQKNIGLVFAFSIFLFCLATVNTVHAAALYTAVPVSDSGADNTLADGNTARKVAVAPDGTIYVVYHSATNGVRVARSIDRGQTFQASIQLDTANGDPEVTVDQNNVVYVAWISGGGIGGPGTEVKLSRSTNKGVTFSTPTTVGTTPGAGTVHMAVSSPYVYIISRLGTTLFVNSNSGVGAFTATTVDSSVRAYSDVHVDPLTGVVYVQDDDPNVLYFTSTDHGQTFSAAQNPGYDVWYSTTASSFNATDKFLYINGGPLDPFNQAASLRINLNNNSITSTPFTDTDTSSSRSLAADELGNVISGFVTGADVKYEISTDKGVSVGTAVVVGAGEYISLAINPIYGDIIATYSSGGSVYVSVYQNELSRGSATGNVSATLQASAASVVAGTTISATGTITNIGHSPAINTVAVFTIPSGQGSLTTDSSDCVGSGSTITCTYTSLPVAGSRSISLSVHTSDSFSGTSAVSASVSSTTTDTDTSNNTGSAPINTFFNGTVMFIGATNQPDLSKVSFTINNDAPTTASPSVALHITTGEDIRFMALSNAKDFYGAGIETLSSSPSWTLCSSCESGKTYTVYLMLYTEHGQSTTLSKSIVYNPGVKNTNPKKVTFVSTLKLGSNSQEVLSLQKYLNANGFVIAKSGVGSPGKETTTFGPATKNAVMKLQLANAKTILAPAYLTAPNGIVGPATRAYLNSQNI